MLGSTLLVIGVQNPIHSILLLIVVFSMGSVLLFSLKLEVFGLIFLLVYIGAIVVLFLFIVMMLDIKMLNTAQKIKDFFSFYNLIIVLILLEVLIFANQDFLFLNVDEIYNSDTSLDNLKIDYSLLINTSSHISNIGEVLFNESLNIEAFLLISIVLFISMVGAIIITIEESNKKTVKQQDAVQQINKIAENTVFKYKLHKV